MTAGFAGRVLCIFSTLEPLCTAIVRAISSSRGIVAFLSGATLDLARMSELDVLLLVLDTTYAQKPYAYWDASQKIYSRSARTNDPRKLEESAFTRSLHHSHSTKKNSQCYAIKMLEIFVSQA